MDFSEIVADFANRHSVDGLTAETWRRLLADFRPVAAQAAAEEESAPAFGAGGFMQV